MKVSTLYRENGVHKVIGEGESFPSDADVISCDYRVFKRIVTRVKFKGVETQVRFSYNKETGEISGIELLGFED